MSVIFLIAGLLCLIYYGFLAIFAGHTVGVALFWLIVGIFFILLFIAFFLRKKGIRKFRLTLFIKVFIITSAVIIFCAFGYVSILIAKEMKQDSWNAEPEFVIVLGAAVRGNSANAVLEARIDAAASYWRVHPNVIIIVSGGNSSENQPSEAQIMREALLEAGVPQKNIITETRSASTEENLRYSLEIIGDNVKEGIVIITSNFHMFRALHVAEGLTDVPIYGYPVSSPVWEMPYYFVYECMALFKSWMSGYIEDGAFWIGNYF